MSSKTPSLGPSHSHSAPRHALLLPQVRANMTGINQLRNREGYAMDGKIMQSLNAEKLQRAATARPGGEEGVHAIKTFHRIS